MGLSLYVNGQPNTFELPSPTLASLVHALGFQSDRIAIERNGTIIPRRLWQETILETSDRLEVVHFVGGGAPARS